MAKDTIKLSPAQTLQVVGRSSEALDLDASWTTGGKPPPTHWHPHQHEHFEVLEGQLTVQVGAEPPRILRTGDTVHVPPRTAHRMWNADTEQTRASWRVSPPMRTEEMFRYLAEGRSPPRELRMLWTFRREFRIGKPIR